MNTHAKNHQAGFTLIEFIVALVIAGIAAAMVSTYFSSALTQSSEPIRRLKQVSNLHQVMENIIADYERLNQLNLRYKWRSNAKYQVGDIVVPSNNINTATSTVANNGRYYICTQSGVSNSTNLPEWIVTPPPIPPLTSAAEISDGTVKWKEYGYTWKETTSYPANAIVVPAISNGHFYKRPGAAFTSGGTPPTAWLTEPNATVNDGMIEWTEVGTTLDRNNTNLTDSILCDSIKYYLDNDPGRYGTGYSVVSAETKFIKFSGTPPAEENATGTNERNLLKVTIKNNDSAETLTQLFTIQ